MRLATVQSVVAIAVVLVGVALLASAIRGVAALEPPLETAARRAPDRVLVQKTTYDCPARSDPSYEPAIS
jgi:hypothetical protein